jgi:hypothetical protein
MKKVILLCGMLLAVTASLASAGAGTNLRWTNCFIDAGAQNQAFACNTNANTPASIKHHLIGSFQLGADLTQVSGVSFIVDLASAGASLPPWWQFKNVGTCRATSLNFSPAIPGSAVSCADWAPVLPGGGLASYTVGVFGPTSARMIAGFAVPATALADLLGGQEYFAFDATIDNTKTVGTGSCAGCDVPVCIAMHEIIVATPPVAGEPSRDVRLDTPANGTDSDVALWQGGAGANSLRGAGCPAATPTRSSTWSSVKSLYR